MVASSWHSAGSGGIILLPAHFRPHSLAGLFKHIHTFACSARCSTPAQTAVVNQQINHILQITILTTYTKSVHVQNGNIRGYVGGIGRHIFMYQADYSVLHDRRAAQTQFSVQMRMCESAADMLIRSVYGKTKLSPLTHAYAYTLYGIYNSDILGSLGRLKAVALANSIGMLFRLIYTNIKCHMHSLTTGEQMLTGHASGCVSKPLRVCVCVWECVHFVYLQNSIRLFNSIYKSMG